MPRIEIVERDGESPSPTEDICKSCFESHMTWYGERARTIFGNKYSSVATIESEDVEHPPYSYEEYSCALCQVRLDSKDD